MRARLEQEHPDHFVMNDGRAPFKVPKSGLSEKLQNEIRAMGPKMAAGGAVPLGGAGSGPVVYGADGRPLMPGPVSVAALPPTMLSRVPAEVQPVELTRAEPYPAPLGTSSEERPWLKPEMNHVMRDAYKLTAAERPADSRDPLMAEIRRGEDQARDHKTASAELGIRPAAAKPPPEPPTAPAPAAAPPAAPRGTGGGGFKDPGMVDMKGGIEAQKGAAVMNANAAAEVGKATADALGAYERQLQATQLEDKQRAERAAAKSAEMVAASKAVAEEMRNIDTTVDPGRYWANKPTVGRVTGIIGLALGAFGAGPDGINRAAAMINQAIDRDMEAQKAQHTLRLQKGRQAADAAQTAYALQHQIFGDEKAASDATKASLLQLAELQVKKILAGSSDKVAAAQAQALLGQLQVQSGQLQSQAADTAFDNNTQRMLAGAQMAASGAKPAPGAVETAKTVAEVSDRATNLRSNIAKAKALIQKSGTFELVGGDQQLLTKALSDMATDAAKLKDPTSVARPGEVENEERALGVEAGALLTSNATALKLLEAYERGVDEREATAYKVRGLQAPARPDKKGAK